SWRGVCQSPARLEGKAVIRIHQICEDSVVRLVVEGTLSGIWVNELRKSWLDARATSDHSRVRVELTAVSYIDDDPRQLLKQMFPEGAELRATGVMTKGILEEIASDGQSRSQR